MKIGEVGFVDNVVSLPHILMFTGKNVETACQNCYGSPSRVSLIIFRLPSKKLKEQESLNFSTF